MQTMEFAKSESGMDARENGGNVHVLLYAYVREMFFRFRYLVFSIPQPIPS